MFPYLCIDVREDLFIKKTEAPFHDHQQTQ